MANDFLHDSNCKALWRFESGVLTVDSKGANTLANVGVTENLADYKEGACCASFLGSSSQYMHVDDASLDAGFPYKTGDATKIISLSFWIKPTLIGGATYRYLLQKNECFNIQIGAYYSNSLRFTYYYGPSSSESWSIVNLVANQWYHVGFAHDGVGKTCLCRIYDVTAGVATTYNKSWGHASVIQASEPITIGVDNSLAYFYTGLLDELVVFNALRTAADFDSIRQGTYSYATPDTEAPVVTEFVIPPTYYLLSLPITTFTATDNVGVSGYLITNSPATPDVNDIRWSPWPWAYYSVSSTGSQTLYAWAKDAAGNISTPLSAVTDISYNPQYAWGGIKNKAIQFGPVNNAPFWYKGGKHNPTNLILENQENKAFYNEGSSFAGPSPIWSMDNKDFGDATVSDQHDPYCGYWGRQQCVY
jgi:hypothetical protein